MVYIPVLLHIKKQVLKKNEFDKHCGMFDDSVIFDIAKKLERTEYAVK